MSSLGAWTGALQEATGAPLRRAVARAVPGGSQGLASAVGLALVLGACDGSSDRPGCNLGNCFGDGDADADADTDADSDGDGDAVDCTDVDDDGHVDLRCPDGDDCDDQDPDVLPGATEVCNGLDDDCEGGVDEGMLEAGADVVLPVPAPGVYTGPMAFAAWSSGFGLLQLYQADLDAGGGWHLHLTELDAQGAPTETVAISETPKWSYWETLGLAPLPDGGWLAAWSDTEGRPLVDYAGVTVLGRIADGRVADQTTLGDSAAPGDVTPAVAVGLTTAAVVWNHNDEQVAYAVVDLQSLEVVHGETLVDRVALNWGRRPAVVGTGEGFLVAAALGGGRTRTWSLSPTGEIRHLEEISSGQFGVPSLAWDDLEAALLHAEAFDLGATELIPLSAEGVPTFDSMLSGVVKFPVLRGAPRAFAMAGVTMAAANTLRGQVRFAVFDPQGAISNELAPDDTASEGASYAIPAPARDGWAVAWSAGGEGVRIDFIGCPP